MGVAKRLMNSTLWATTPLTALQWAQREALWASAACWWGQSHGGECRCPLKGQIGTCKPCARGLCKAGWGNVRFHLNTCLQLEDLTRIPDCHCYLDYLRGKSLERSRFDLFHKAVVCSHRGRTSFVSFLPPSSALEGCSENAQTYQKSQKT